MATVNGNAAIAWMQAKGTNVPGSCLNTIWQAYGSHPSIGGHAGQYPDAIDGWRYALRQHPGDLTPPPGFPVYFDALSRPRYAGDTNYASGDIVLSVGGGQVICTDGAGAGRIAVMSITQRARQIGRTYLGWTEDFLGYDVATTNGAGLGATPLTEGFLMTLSDADQADLKSKIDWLFDNTKVPGQPFGWPKAVNDKIDELTPLVKDVQGRVRGTDPRGDMLQLLMEKVGGQAVSNQVDPKGLADALIQAGVGAAVADELSKRLAG